MMQHSQSSHLQESALAELDVANRQLADAGKTIDELRFDVLALAARVDAARAEAESFRNDLGRLNEQGDSSTAEHDAQQCVLLAEIASLKSLNTDLEAHVARLKRQLERPERLLVKKVLRRGPYATRDAS